MGKNIIDQYSYLHFAVGIILFYWDIDLITAIILHTIFEIVENTLKEIFDLQISPYKRLLLININGKFINQK